MVISICCRIDEYLGAKDWQEVVEKVIEVLISTRSRCLIVRHRIHNAY